MSASLFDSMRSESARTEARERTGARRQVCEERVLADLYSGSVDLKRLATRLNLSLSELAQWASTERGARSLWSLRRLAEQRAGLALSRAKADAARALLKLARQGESKEIARKACVDLLRLSSDASVKPDDREDDELSPQEQRAWREALEGVGLASTSADRGAGALPVDSSDGGRDARPTGDRPTGDRPTGDRPTGNHPTGDQTS